VLGLALAMIAQFIALLMTGAGHGWITPFWFAPLLFVLNPIAFVRVAGRRKGGTIDILLIALAVMLDVALYAKTAAEGVAYFWRVSPFNWLWLALWSAWPIAVAANLAYMSMSRPADRM
jgi:hypothetical protein